MLNRKKQIELLAMVGDIGKAAAARQYDQLMNAYRESLKKGEWVKLHGVGAIRPSLKSATKERTGRNPRTGEPLVIPAKPERRDLKINESGDMRRYLNS